MPSPESLIDPERTDRLAEVAVRVGLGLRPGQELILTAPVTALSLVRRIAAHAYGAGAGLVTALYADEETERQRYLQGGDGSFDRAAGWLYRGQAEAMAAGAARMAVFGGDPGALDGQDPGKVARAQRAYGAAADPIFGKIARFETNWTVLAYPSPGWARAVFPDLPADAAMARLADAVFAASRVDAADPVAAWAAHNRELHARRDWLNAQRFTALHFTGPGTDLTVGLVEGMSGRAARSRRETASPACPTFPPRRSPPCPMPTGWRASCGPPSRSAMAGR